MTPLYQAMKYARTQMGKFDGRWFVRAFAMLIIRLSMIGVPAVAQQANVSAPLNADEVMDRVVPMNEVRAKALESYSSVRSYHLECHCLSHKKADMVVRADYRAPNKKEFTIVSESGSGTVRDRVFKKLLEAEQESMRERISSGPRSHQRTTHFNCPTTRGPARTNSMCWMRSRGARTSFYFAARFG